MARGQFDKRRKRAMADFVSCLVTLIAGKDWHGQENLPKEGGFIAVSNHVSYVDPTTLAQYLYLNGYVPHFLAKSPLFDVPVVGTFLRAFDQIPVHRGTVRAKEAVDKGLEVLGKGGVIAMFPEGTLTRDPDLWPMVPRTGVARMALSTQVPVIPIIQWGVHRILGPYGKMLWILPRKKVTMVAGPPIDLSDLYDKPIDTELLRTASDRIMDTLTAMLEEIRGEKAPVPRHDMRKRGQA
jgi:1-acyl-sn-glycerol-3-phosphate acyltransferase